MSERRFRFGIVDLLAIIIVTGLVLAVLLPALMRKREQARLNACVHNLKNLTLGMQNHRDVYKIWPTAGYAATYHASYTKEMKPYIGPRQNAGWGFQISPYLEGD